MICFALVLLISTSYTAFSADFVATLDSSDGSSAFVFNDSGDNTVISLDSNGNVQIKGGMRLDASGVKCTTAEMLIVDGKIGIGVTDPQYSLDVNGSGRFLNGSNYLYWDGAADINLKSASRGSGGRAIVHDGSNILTINFAGDFSGGTKIASNTFFSTNETTGTSYIKTGFMGVGLDNPSAKLHVLQNGSQTSAIIAGSGGSYFNDWPGGWGGGLSTWDICCASVYYTGLTSRSDKSLKKDITSLDDSIFSRLMQLNPVSFRWKDTRNGTGLHYGFIAQEVEPFFPELVTESDNPDKTRAIAVTEMISLLTKAVQELKEKTDQLEQKISESEAGQ